MTPRSKKKFQVSLYIYVYIYVRYSTCRISQSGCVASKLAYDVTSTHWYRHELRSTGLSSSSELRSNTGLLAFCWFSVNSLHLEALLHFVSCIQDTVLQINKNDSPPITAFSLFFSSHSYILCIDILVIGYTVIPLP